jgi:hypothetical protein
MAALAIGALARGAYAQEALDDLEQELTFATADGALVAHVSALADVTLFAQDAPAQGLLFSDNDTYAAPRIAVFFDADVGDRVLLHAQLDADRGEDPGAQSRGDVRLDEYFIESRLTDAGRLTLRLGKFATAFGGWVARHLAWDNPMITAPLIYEDVLPMTDRTAPPNRAAFARRRDLIDNQGAWLPIVWGASYATGGSVAAGTDTLDAIVEVKTAGVSSRPSTWDALAGGSETDSSVTAALRWRPAAEWSFGSSFSRGPYLQDDAARSRPPGKRIADYDQTSWGGDAAYEHRRLQVWSELVRTEFAVPGIGDVAAWSGYVEARYKATPQVWIGSRWNQSWFDDIPGLDVSWNRDMRRWDLALGYRHTNHIEVKVQYSLSDQAGRSIDGKHLFATQLVLRL